MKIKSCLLNQVYFNRSIFVLILLLCLNALKANSFELICNNIFVLQINLENNEFKRVSAGLDTQKTKYKIENNELYIKYPHDGMFDFKGGNQLIQRGYTSIRRSDNLNNYYEFLGKDEIDSAKIVYTFFKRIDGDKWHLVRSKAGISKKDFLYTKDYWYECIQE